MLSALTEIGKGKLYGELDSGVAYDSNIYLDRNELGDSILFARPSLEYLQDSGLLRIESEIYTKIERYDEYSEEDSEDYGFSLKLSYPEGDVAQFKTDAEVRWARLTEPNPEVGDILRTDAFELKGSLTTRTSEKFRFRSRGRFQQRDPENAPYREFAISYVDVSAMYAISPKVLVFSGGGLAYYDQAGVNNTGGNSVRGFVGAEGQFTPKLEGDIMIGYSQREFASPLFEDRGAIVAETTLTWQAGPKTTVEAKVERSFGLAATNVSVLSTAVGVSVRHKFTSKISVEALLGTGWLRLDAPQTDQPSLLNSRSDHEIRGDIKFTYEFNEQFSVRAGILVADRASDVAIFEYGRHRFGLAGSARF